MITQEQIKNLKEGDSVIMHGTFDGESPFGNIIIKHKEQMLSGISEKSRVYVHPSAVSLPSEHGTFLSLRRSVGAETEVPTPKHDPFRPFRVGDKVRPKKLRGKYYSPADKNNALNILTVDCDEGTGDRDTEIWVKNDEGATFYFGKDHAYTFEQAATRAEAERDRLNAEWRKEQK